MTTTNVRLQHNSMQFSDEAYQQRSDMDAVFKRARDRKVMFVTGTESGAGGNHVLYDALRKTAPLYGFKVNAHKWGDWVAVNVTLADFVESGYDGPHIPGTKGLKASQGAHSPRGIAWLTAKAKTQGVGTITVGAVHYLTARSIKVSGSNAPLQKGIADWGKEKGKGSALVFVTGDVNMHDDTRDVFNGHPFTTCWDELGKYPATHGRDKAHGSTIDIIASYNADGRVSCKAAAAQDDSTVKLATDHFLIEATYTVRTK
jgi:hypothetical protein